MYFLYCRLCIPFPLKFSHIFLFSLSFTLAKCELNSWNANNRDSVESQRMLSILLLGLSIDVNRNIEASKKVKNQLLSEVNVSLNVSVSPSISIVACQLSDVVVRLSYLDYLALQRIMSNNVGCKVDKSKWDNLEVAWEKETGNIGQEVDEQKTFSNGVMYSTNARLVRYGQGEKLNSKKPSANVNLRFESLSVLLRRDDIWDFPAAPYDMVLARVQDFEFELGRKEDGGQWLNASVKQIFVFDLGRSGRKERRSSGKMHDALQIADYATVLLQGYTPLHNQRKDSDFDSQIVLKVDRDAPPAGLTKVVIVVSFLSIAPMVGPLRDVIDFVTCEWDASASLETDSQHTESPVRNDDIGLESEATVQPSAPTSSPQRIFRVQFVSHYPRLVFAADENDLQSKALVLRGYVISTISIMHDLPMFDSVCAHTWSFLGFLLLTCVCSNMLH